MVLDGPEFWMLLLLNLAVCFARHTGIFDPSVFKVELPWHLTGATGSLMTFFVCFYNGHVYSRYQNLYHITKHMTEHVMEIVSILRVQIRDIVARRRIAKLVVASCIMFFFERTEDSNDVNVSAQEYAKLKHLELLGEEEANHLQKHSVKLGAEAQPCFLVMQWAMQLMRQETEAPEGRDDMLYGFYQRIYHVRRCQAEVVQILELPMPFQYFHIMNLMLALNLVLWAYCLGCQDSFFAPVIYMFVQLMFQGIRELASALSNPFGTDEVDFPVHEWMMTIYSRVYGLLEDPYDISKSDYQSVKKLQHPDTACELIGEFIRLEDVECLAPKALRTKDGYVPVFPDDPEEEYYEEDEVLEEELEDDE
eukprot:TRINITY_DN15710_c0_g1_i2.p1 TRINITY_DN15710_c0_g1~~TRINITY_DN15710_c0_g1_i2.p1  ORF type:complete len:365 (+),score=99.28 TRINITY_DN15710_c0_g1_i2:238-1332(+)